MKPKQFSTVAPWAIAFVVAFIIGWKFASDPANEVTLKTNDQEQSESRRIRPDRTGKSESASEQRMRSISGAGSPEDKVRAAIALANSISPSEFSAWAEGDLFSYRSGPEMFIFRMILFERWQNEDLDGLIAWTGKNYYGQAFHAMQFLASEQPEALIEHYRNFPDDRTELKNLALIAKKYPDLAIARLHELSLDGSADDIFRSTKDLFKMLAQNSPGTLEASLSSLPPELITSAKTALLGKKLEMNFPDAIKGLGDDPLDWEMFKNSVYNNRTLQSQILDHLGDLPESWTSKISDDYYRFIGSGNAKQWLDTDLASKGFTEREVKRIREQALYYAARSEPEYTLSAVADAEFSKQLKERIISSAMSSAGGDAKKAEALIGLLSSEDDKNLARANFETLQAASLKKTNPAAWLLAAASGPSGATNSYEIATTVKNLELSDPTALREQFENMSEAQKANLANAIGTSVQNGNVSAGFSGDAIRYLVENPPKKSDNSSSARSQDPAFVSSNYAVNLAIKDPAAGTQWVATLPDGEAKSWAQKNLAKNLAQYDPKFVEQWTKSLPAGERDAVNAYLRE